MSEGVLVHPKQKRKADPELSLGLQYQKRGPKRKMFSNEPCRVCGEPATGFNYRVVSCNACKAFFRRAALSGRKYVCKFKNMNIKSEKNVDWLLICQHCRLEKCREAGMKDDYVHNLRLHRVMTKGSVGDKANFRNLLDPGQLALVDIFTTFWTLYTGGEVESEPTVDLTSEYTSRIQKEMENVERPIPPSMDSSSMARLSQTQYLASVVKYHMKLVDTLFNQIPELKPMSGVCRESLTRIGACQMSVLRGTYRSKYEKYEDFIDVDGDDSSTAFMSITNKSLDTQKLQRLGIPPDLIGQIFELCNFLRTPPNEKPDFINWSILSGLCLFNNGSSHLPDVNETEKMTIERLQESLLTILRIKLQQDGKNLMTLANYISFLAELRVYTDSEKTKQWGKFLYYSPKICLASNGAESDVNKSQFK